MLLSVSGYVCKCIALFYYYYFACKQNHFYPFEIKFGTNLGVIIVQAKIVAIGTVFFYCLIVKVTFRPDRPGSICLFKMLILYTVKIFPFQKVKTCSNS